MKLSNFVLIFFIFIFSFLSGCEISFKSDTRVITKKIIKEWTYAVYDLGVEVGAYHADYNKYKHKLDKLIDNCWEKSC